MEGFWVDDSIHDGQSTPKIQIADGIMVLAHGGLWMFYMEHRKEIPYRIGVEFLSGM